MDNKTIKNENFPVYLCNYATLLSTSTLLSVFILAVRNDLLEVNAEVIPQKSPHLQKVASHFFFFFFLAALLLSAVALSHHPSVECKCFVSMWPDILQHC